MLYSLKDSLNIIITKSTDTHFAYMNAEGLFTFGVDSIKNLEHFHRSQIFADLETYQYVKVKLLSCGKINSERILFRKFDHSNFWGLLTSTARTENNDIVYEEVIVDISKEIDQERKLVEKTYQLEKVSTELDRFIYSASHDLRAPISTMMGLLSLMKSEKTLDYDKYLGFLEDSLLKLDNHIRKLTTFSKITNELIAYQSIDLKKTAEDIVSELFDHINYEKVTFELVISGNSTIKSDYSKVRIILFQLIKNAYDFADMNKSRSFLSIKVIDLVDLLRIEIVDNGIGIEDIHQPHVFKLFYRASEKSKGSGLGLYMVKEALMKLHGTIELHSNFKVGTSVVVVIPKGDREENDDDPCLLSRPNELTQ